MSDEEKDKLGENLEEEVKNDNQDTEADNKETAESLNPENINETENSNENQESTQSQDESTDETSNIDRKCRRKERT